MRTGALFFRLGRTSTLLPLVAMSSLLWIALPPTPTLSAAGPATQPGPPAASEKRIRLLIAEGRFGDARAEIDRVEADQRNRWLDLVKNEEDFASYIKEAEEYVTDAAMDRQQRRKGAADQYYMAWKLIPEREREAALPAATLLDILHDPRASELASSLEKSADPECKDLAKKILDRVGTITDLDDLWKKVERYDSDISKEWDALKNTRAQTGAWKDQTVAEHKARQFFNEFESLKEQDRKQIPDGAMGSKHAGMLFIIWRSMPADWPADDEELKGVQKLYTALRKVVEASQDRAAADRLDEELRSSVCRYLAQYCRGDKANPQARLAKVVQWASQKENGLNVRAELDPWLAYNLILHDLKGSNDKEKVKVLKHDLDEARFANYDPARKELIKGIDDWINSSPALGEEDGPKSTKSLVKDWTLEKEEPLRIYTWNGDPQLKLVFRKFDKTYIGTTEVPLGLFIGVLREAKGTAVESAEALLGKRINDNVRVWTPPTLKAGYIWRAEPPPTGIKRLYLSGDDNNRLTLRDGNPSTEHPMQMIAAAGAIRFAKLLGCRLPTEDEWRSVFKDWKPAKPPNLRDDIWKQQRDYVAPFGLPGLFPDHRASAFPYGATEQYEKAEFWPQVNLRQLLGDQIPDPYDDGYLYFRPVTVDSIPGKSGRGHMADIVGNVAEFICADTQELRDAKDLAAIDAWLTKNPGHFAVIGGSALSPPPEVPAAIAKALSVPKEWRDFGFADVGFRLAFSAGGTPDGGDIADLRKLLDKHLYQSPP